MAPDKFKSQVETISLSANFGDRAFGAVWLRLWNNLQPDLRLVMQSIHTQIKKSSANHSLKTFRIFGTVDHSARESVLPRSILTYLFTSEHWTRNRTTMKKCHKNVVTFSYLAKRITVSSSTSAYTYFADVTTLCGDWRCRTACVSLLPLTMQLYSATATRFLEAHLLLSHAHRHEWAEPRRRRLEMTDRSTSFVCAVSMRSPEHWLSRTNNVPLYLNATRVRWSLCWPETTSFLSPCFKIRILLHRPSPFTRCRRFGAKSPNTV